MRIHTCHECGLVVKTPDVPHKHKAICPRCNHTLVKHHNHAQERILVFSITALIFLCLSIPFEFISFSAAGRTQTISIPSGVSVLIQNGYLPLALLQLLLIVVIPAIVLSGLIYLISKKRRNKPTASSSFVLKLVYNLLPWSMAEIFLVGVLVSLIKIVSMADISLGFSFYAFMAFVFCKTIVLLYLDKSSIYRWFDLKPHEHEPNMPVNVRIQYTWALLITAVLLYIPANMWPIMHTNLLGQSEPSTIMGGIILLWKSGSYPIATIIFVASVIVPAAKLIILFWLNISIQKNQMTQPNKKLFWYRVTEFIGKWSMVDVFVVAILVSLVQLGNAMSIYPGPAAMAFSGVVIATMLAAHNLDPKTLWTQT